MLIYFLTSAKSSNFLPGISSNTPYGFGSYSLGVYTNLNSRGLLVTTPSPLGKKSRPTIYSRRDDFPLLYVPRTVIRGREMYFDKPKSLNLSTNVITFLKFSNKYPY